MIPWSALIVSDLHAHTAHPFSRPLPNGRPSRFQDLLDVLDSIETLARREQVSDLLILGDLTHRRHFINWRLYNALYRKLATLAATVERTTILAGNHDYEDETTHSLSVLMGLPNVHVIDEPFRPALSTGDRIQAIPYLHDPLAVSNALLAAPVGLPLVMHYAFEGVPLESDYWLPSPLKIGQASKFPIVFNGHIHKPSIQKVGSTDVVNVGAPMHFDFGDAGERYVTLTDWKTYERVPLSAPTFHTAKWPRVPSPNGAGFLRILGVPKAKLVDAKEMAVKMGWTDAVALEESLPEAVREAISSGLVLDRALLERHVAKECPDLPADQQTELVDEGLYFLTKVRA